MTKDDCKFNFEWDYLEWKSRVLEGSTYDQRDWNQTLMTKINQTSATIHKASLRGGANKIITIKKLQPLFEILDYYFGYRLGGRYVVEFNDDLCFKFGVKFKYPEDVIYVFNSEVERDRVLVPNISEATEEQWGEVSFRFPDTHEELVEYKKRLCGSVTILNYE